MNEWKGMEDFKGLVCQRRLYFPSQLHLHTLAKSTSKSHYERILCQRRTESNLRPLGLYLMLSWFCYAVPFFLPQYSHCRPLAFSIVLLLFRDFIERGFIQRRC